MKLDTHIDIHTSLQVYIYIHFEIVTRDRLGIF